MSSVQATKVLSEVPEPALAALFTALRHMDDDDYQITIRVKRRHLEYALETEREARVRVEEAQPESWRELLWTTHAETRLDLGETCEALGRSKRWVYRRVANEAIPFRKLGGELVFVAGELRVWLQAQ